MTPKTVCPVSLFTAVSQACPTVCLCVPHHIFSSKKNLWQGLRLIPGQPPLQAQENVTVSGDPYPIPIPIPKIPKFLGTK